MLINCGWLLLPSSRICHSRFTGRAPIHPDYRSLFFIGFKLLRHFTKDRVHRFNLQWECVGRMRKGLILHIPEAKNASSLHTSCTYTIKPKWSSPSLYLNTVCLGRPPTAKTTCKNKLLTTDQQHCCLLQCLGNETYFVPLNFLKHVQVSGVRDAPMYNEDFLINQGGKRQPAKDILNHLQDFLPMHLGGQVRKEKMLKCIKALKSTSHLVKEIQKYTYLVFMHYFLGETIAKGTGERKFSGISQRHPWHGNQPHTEPVP